MKYKLIIIFVIGVAIGTSFSWFVFDSKLTQFAIDQIYEAEDISRQYFINTDLDPISRGNATAWFLRVTGSAWLSGVLPEDSFNRASAVGFLRMCIIHELQGKKANAELDCKFAEESLNHWAPNISFEEFRNVVGSYDFLPYMLSNKSLKPGTPHSGAP